MSRLIWRIILITWIYCVLSVWAFFPSTSAVCEPTIYPVINWPLERSVLICCPTGVSTVFIEEWKLSPWIMMWCLPACSVSLWTISSPLSDPQLYGLLSVLKWMQPLPSIPGLCPVMVACKESTWQEEKSWPFYYLFLVPTDRKKNLWNAIL